jgi:prephenate dehydrogenase
MKGAAELARAAGAEPVVMTAEVHDRVVAITSHLPATVAVGLVQLAGDLAADIDSEAFLAGPGLRSASRLAAGDPSMMAQALSDNADNLGRAIELLVDQLRELHSAVEADPSGLRERLANAVAAHGMLLEMADVTRS